LPDRPTAPYVGAVGILLLLLGMLAAGSGALKLRSHARALLGASPLAVVELAAGALTVIGSGIGLARLRPLAWAAVGVVALLIIVSTVAHTRVVVTRQRARSASEERRFRARVRGQMRT
jgi:hypothetical protein